MTTTTTTQLRKTALNCTHRGLGAKMVNFGGWDMPVEYSGIIAEHMATRTAAGLFDVSHMGEIEVRGPHALDLVQFVTSNDAARLVDGQAQYSGIDDAGLVDICRTDLLVHKHFGHAHHFLVASMPAIRTWILNISACTTGRAQNWKIRAPAIRNLRFKDQKRWAFCRS